ncbi:hypothetical protein ANO11243_014650 [Dothideomycetidae sp. 11243]|nr:hypothetical protein ANO11243_014650 [fungal sp. No.11243]
MLLQCLTSQLSPCFPTWLLVCITVLGWATCAHCMTADELAALKQDARYIFYHGLTSYHKYAWPEDELRPLSCAPLTRDRANPAHIEVNDVLGNYSLSVVDSLSTLAILASSPTSDHDNYNALEDFQKYTSLLVDQYGDGSSGPAGQGLRARGFDLDSKVQLFETTIRGLGGLLSAHLFAVGDLPIRGYTPDFQDLGDGREGMPWNITTSAGEPFVYDGQLLRLALDLGKRLLPAFHTPTGIPYPRVNLRSGIPFYENSPLNNDAEHGQCDATQKPKTEREITETCSAGAGSLVLEFSVLSRLTGDDRFEKLAKKAFQAVWERRSTVGLIGSGIDAETGQWVSPYTGIGAGIDSFFEYAFKSHILLSGLEGYGPEFDNDVSSVMFLDIWNASHAAIKRHIYRGPQFQHPHYAQNDMWNGGPRLGWIDSLSAYFPGLLTLAGEVEEATATQLLYTALWTRYGALPERWNTFTGKIDSGLNWWGGRPEFIESNWYLYRATQDPWYLHVGEMAIKDIKRRCWTPCGWGGLQDVQTGELNDRMESFFLGETAKYLFYPWTLPISLIPPLGTSSSMIVRHTFDLTFPTLSNTLPDFSGLQRIEHGILIKSISGLRMALVLDRDEAYGDQSIYRVYALSGLALGRDEGLWFQSSVLSQLNPTDPHLTHMKDVDSIDLILDVPVPELDAHLISFFANPSINLAHLHTMSTPGETLLRALPEVLLSDRPRLAAQLDSLADLNLPNLNLDEVLREAAQGLRDRAAQDVSSINAKIQPGETHFQRYYVAAMLPFGPGAAPLPSVVDKIPDPNTLPIGGLPFKSVLVLDSDLCGPVLPSFIPRNYSVLVVRRGGCSFSEKLANIPSYPPLDDSLKLVLVIGLPSPLPTTTKEEAEADSDPDAVHRPYLHLKQTSPAGVDRRSAIPLVLIHAGDDTWDVLYRTASAVASVVDEEVRVHGPGGLAIKRRYWFACNGIRIANLHVA